MKITTLWGKRACIDIPVSDTFAVEAAAEFGIKLTPIRGGILRGETHTENAARFARHCEE